MEADPDPDREAFGPCPGANLPLDGERRLETRAGLLEDGEHLVGPGIDLAAAMLAHRSA